MKRLPIALCALLAAATSLSACKTTEDYAAKVNGEVISSQTILDELHTVSSNPRYVALLNERLGGVGSGSGLQPGGSNTISASYTAQSVFNRVLVALIYQAAAKEHVTPTPDQISEAEKGVHDDLGDEALYKSLPTSYRDYLVNRQAVLTALMATRDTPQAEQQYYDQHVSNYTQYCVRHILVASQTEADQLRSQISGGADFAAIAKQSSLDNQGQGSSASQGGALGCFSRDQLDQFVPEFRDATVKLKVNELSQPTKTQFGYHLIQVTSITVQPLNDVRATIKQQLTSAGTFLTDQLASAKIKVNPRFGVYRPADPAQGRAATIDPPAVNAVLPKSTSTTSMDPSAGLAPQ